MKTALYFDTVNFASRITAPVMAGLGFIDTISASGGRVDSAQPDSRIGRGAADDRV